MTAANGLQTNGTNGHSFDSFTPSNSDESRWEGVQRPYTQQDVEKLRGEIPRNLRPCAEGQESSREMTTSSARFTSAHIAKNKLKNYRSFYDLLLHIWDLFYACTVNLNKAHSISDAPSDSL